MRGVSAGGGGGVDDRVMCFSINCQNAFLSPLCRVCKLACDTGASLPATNRTSPTDSLVARFPLGKRIENTRAVEDMPPTALLRRRANKGIRLLERVLKLRQLRHGEASWFLRDGLLDLFHDGLHIH
jgi:hypothetical protein